MKNKVLVLDDDQDILDIISYTLMEKGFNIFTLIDGKDIFLTIESFKPDLILMDVMLGNMDGRLICRDIKKKRETQALPVILISASHDLAESLRQDGAPNDFIAKPFDIYKLTEKVEQLLNS
jgi:DNA-binding response OmpR family regulator